MILSQILINDVYEIIEEYTNSYTNSSKVHNLKDYYTVLNSDEVFVNKNKNVIDFINLRNCTDFFRQRTFDIFKLENLGKQILLEVLSSYDTKSVYGVLVKHKDNVFNPMHVYERETFLEYLDTIEESDESFSIYSYVYNQDILKTQEINSEILNDYLSSMDAEYFRFKKFRKSIEIKHKCTFSNGSRYSEYSDITPYELYAQCTKLVLTGTDITLKSSSSYNGYEKGLSYILPVSLCSHPDISFPYYGLLSILNLGEDVKCLQKDENETSKKLFSTNLSSNFLSGNTNQFYDGLFVTNKPNGSIQMFGHSRIWQLFDIKNHLSKTFISMEDVVEVVKREYNLDNIRYSNISDLSEEFKHTAQLSSIKSEFGTSYTLTNSLNSLIYSSSVCVGDLKQNIDNIHVLRNMNLHSMFSKYCLGHWFLEEAQAHQILSQKYYKSII